jgi:hypothetical protein
VSNINSTAGIALNIGLNPAQEDAMAAKPKSAKVRSAARKRTVCFTGGRARRNAAAADSWEQIAEVPEERDDEIDCQRIVQGDGGRRLPAYFDDYN